MNDKLGYKHTPLGWIPEDWEVTKFSGIFSLLSTNSYSRDQLTLMETNSSVYNIHYGDIHSKFESEILDFEIENGIPKIIDTISLNGNTSYLKDGDLVIADASEDYEGLGKSIELKNIGSKKVAGGLHTIVARDHSGKTAKGFRTYILSNPIISKSLKRIATGISVYSISKTELSKLNIILPKKPEQQKIAAILSTWDEAITKTRQLITELQQRNKGLMRQLLTGKKRLKGFEKKWKLKLLSDCLKYTPREVAKPSSNFLALGIRSHGKGIFHKNDFDPAAIAMEALYEVKENDLVVNITFAWEQAIAIAGKEDEGGLVSHRFPTYTFKTESAIPAYFKFLIIQKNFKYMLNFISPGGAGRNRVMSKNNFLKLEIEIPDVDEQKAIADILNSALNEMKLNQQKLSALQQQKKDLMQKLLTGEIRVKIKD